MTEEKLLTEREAKLEALEMVLNLMYGSGSPLAVSVHLGIPTAYRSNTSPIEHRNITVVVNEFHEIAVGLTKEIARLSKEKDGSGEEAAFGEGSRDSEVVCHQP